MKRYIIKTVDSNRYETNEIPLREKRAGIDWLCFSARDGKGTVYVSVSNIVSLTEMEVDE